MATKRRPTTQRGARYATLLSDEGREALRQDDGRPRHRREPYSPRTGAYVKGTKRPTSRSGRTGALIAASLLAFMALGGLWYWLHRPVRVTVNGKSATVAINTTIEQARESLGVTTTPGNLVSVGGNLLAEGDGEPYSLMVNGNIATVDDAKSWRLQGGETIEFAAGADDMEEYTVEVQGTPPRLEIDGDRGSIAYVAQWGRPRRQEMRTGVTSGETVDGDVLDEGQNCIVRITVPNPTNGEKLVALTFDDGPSAYTARYIDILNRYGAHATFFNLGTEVEDMPEAARAIVDSDNEIMSHTNQHLQLTTLDADGIRSEIADAATAIENATGVRTTSIRPPYGDFDANCWLASQGTVSLSVLWTQDSEDWRRQGVSVIVQNALSGLANGSIILMHDGGGNRDMDVEALPQIIEAVQASGYRIVTVSELLAACSDIPTEVAAGYAPMPEDAVWPSELA